MGLRVQEAVTRSGITPETSAVPLGISESGMIAACTSARVECTRLVEVGAGPVTAVAARDLVVVVGPLPAVCDELLQPDTRMAARTRTQLRRCTHP